VKLWPGAPGSLAARFGGLLLALLLFQALLAGVLVSSWLRSRDLKLHQQELREQARLLLPAVEDSLGTWAGAGPMISRKAELRHRMQLSLGRPQAMSLVWVDRSGNMSAAGFLSTDSRLSALKELALANASPEPLERWAAHENLALVARRTPQGWLLLAGSRASGLWSVEGQGLLVLILTASAAIAGVAAWLLARPLLRRFNRFHDAFSRLGGGHMQSRLDDRHPDELGQLAQEFNRMAARLQTLTTELERSDRERRQLVSEVSHELGAPLTNVIGYLDLLQRRLEDEESRHTIRLCRAQARRLDALVMDLLDLARLDDAGLSLRRRTCDLRELVDQEVAAVELACLDRDIELDWRRPGAAFPVLGDEARLAQILRNLLRNAVTHLGRAGQREGRLQVELRLYDQSVELAVRDNGPGMSSETLERLFERYFRPHSEASEGSGLGLCISRKLAELHDGRLEAASPGEGLGATFTLRLPLHHGRVEESA